MSESRGAPLDTDPDLPQVIQFNGGGMKQLTTTKSDRCLLTENKANEGKVDKG